jgi:UDP-N-acetylglucosamine--dolichyl-phosphate N-acetylglucosaminephosphotransferase
MLHVVLIAVGIAFVMTALLTPKFIAFNERIGLTGTDVHKFNRPRIAESGGATVLAGALAGSFIFIWLQVFVYDGLPELPLALAAISTIIIAAFIGLFDDLFALAKRFDGRTGIKRIGLPQWAKPLLMLPAAVPLMAIMAGHTSMTVPLLGAVDFGLAYPLLLVPLAVIGAANATNMLAGLNGLETGLGVVLLGSMGLWAVVTEQPAAAAIALPLSAALAGFLIWNHWPSRILPGDSVSYIIGAAVATVAVIGNMERFAVISFMPWFIELVLKARGRFRAESFGRLRPDGTLESPGKIYSLTHLVMRVGRFKEPQVVAILIGLELLLSVAVWAIYWPIAI